MAQPAVWHWQTATPLPRSAVLTQPNDIKGKNKMILTILKIEGMTCGGCVASVTRVLQQLPGVSQVEVSLQSGTAEITHESGLSPAEALVGAVESAGFGARPG